MDKILFNDNRAEQQLREKKQSLLNIITSEVTHALKLTKSQKTAGPDGICGNVDTPEWRKL